jgi:DNA-directed RNA polymerase specialized sigma24 family protein
MTAHGATLRTATTDMARDAATRDALLAGFGITATARALGVPRGTVQNRAHRLGLVYDKGEGKWTA